MHEHDGSGCTQCKCQASPMNSWPCTCPQNNRGELSHREGVEQTRLASNRFMGQPIGEMTKVRSGQGFTFHVHIYDEWTNLLETADFALQIIPKPAFPRIRPNYPDDTPHIILGEN